MSQQWSPYPWKRCLIMEQVSCLWVNIDLANSYLLWVQVVLSTNVSLYHSKWSDQRSLICMKAFSYRMIWFCYLLLSSFCHILFSRQGDWRSVKCGINTFVFCLRIRCCCLYSCSWYDCGNNWLVWIQDAHHVMHQVAIDFVGKMYLILWSGMLQHPIESLAPGHKFRWFCWGMIFVDDLPIPIIV